MKQILRLILAGLLSVGLFTLTAMGRDEARLGRFTIHDSRFKIQDSRPQTPGKTMKATATAHGITYTWTASTSIYAGLGYNLYVGTTSGGESATPVNSTLIAAGCNGATCTFTYANVVSLATYYAVLATCVPSGSGNVCSARTPEVAATIPLGTGDIASPTGFSGSAF